eukprot:scaffold32927_cov112-Phaeocystis_antarctica.AAC.1
MARACTWSCGDAVWLCAGVVARAESVWPAACLGSLWVGTTTSSGRTTLKLLGGSFRFPQFVARGTTQLSNILRDRKMDVRANALFRASLASIRQNCVLKRVPELLLAVRRVVVVGAC